MAAPMTQVDQALLDEQIADWMAEIKRLADMVSFAKGGNCAFVRIDFQADQGEEPIAAELILEDALRVVPYGWPDGFSFEVLNSTK